MIIWRALVVLLASLVVAACTTPARIGGHGAAFDRVGRFAVNLQPVAEAPYAAQGGFSWRDDGSTLRLDLTNPLGSVLARIVVRPGLSVLERADGSRESAADPDSLLALVWGHAMPVAGLRVWMQGQALAGRPAQALTRDAAGHLTHLQQDGWQVDLSDYDARGPRRVRLLRTDARGHWRLQLVVDDPQG